MTTPQTLPSQHVTLEPLTASDMPYFVKWYSDPEMMRLTGDVEPWTRARVDTASVNDGPQNITAASTTISSANMASYNPVVFHAMIRAYTSSSSDLYILVC